MSQVQGISETIKCAQGDVAFIVYRFPPKLARRHILTIAKILGPSLGELAESAVDGGAVENVDVPIGRIISSIIERIDVSYAEHLMDDCAQYTECNPGGKLDKTYEAIFLGSPAAQAKWFFHALKVQFGDFLAEWAGGLSLANLGGLAQESQSISTG